MVTRGCSKTIRPERTWDCSEPEVEESGQWRCRTCVWPRRILESGVTVLSFKFCDKVSEGQPESTLAKSGNRSGPWRVSGHLVYFVRNEM